MLLHLLPHGQLLAIFRVLRQRGYVRWRGRRRSAEKILKHPLASLHHGGPVRIRRDRQDTALPQQSTASTVGKLHAPELRAVDTGYAIVFCKPLVEICKVRTQQIRDGAVFAKDRVEEQFRLAFKRLTQIGVELGKGVLIRAHLR